MGSAAYGRIYTDEGMEWTECAYYRAIDKSHLIDDCIRKGKVTRLFVVLDATANRDATAMHFWSRKIKDGL